MRDKYAYLGHFRSPKVLSRGHNEGPPKYVKGESKLEGELRGPTGLEFRARGGKTATEMVATVTTPKGKAMNVPLLVPEQEGVKRLLKGKDPTRNQLRRGVKWAKAHGAKRYETIDAALQDEYARHEQLERESD